MRMTWHGDIAHHFVFVFAEYFQSTESYIFISTTISVFAEMMVVFIYSIYANYKMSTIKL